MGWKGKLKKGPWTFEEDLVLLRCIKLHGGRRWSKLAQESGLQRCGRSCRLRWVNYLSPNIKRGNITPQEERIIIDLYGRWGSRWSLIAERIPGRTDNEIKNYWRSHLKKKLQNSTQTQNIGDQNCSTKAQVQTKQVILPQQSLDVFMGNAIKSPLSYENNHNHASVKMDISMNKLSTKEMIRDMEIVQVQLQAEASFFGTGEVEGSSQNDMGIARKDAIEISRMPHSFLSRIPIESHAMGEFKDSCSTNLGLMYPTHECESNLTSDIMMLNMEVDKPLLSNVEDFTRNTIKTPVPYEDKHNHASRWMETSIDKFFIEEMSRDIEHVQVQVEASFVETNEVEGSIQSDISIVGHDVELSTMPYSFLFETPIENYGREVLEDSYFACPKLLYPTHDYEFD